MKLSRIKDQALAALFLWYLCPAMQFLFTIEVSSAHCFMCPKESKIKSSLQHIMNKHHAYSRECFFCIESFTENKTNYSSIDHYKKEHPGLLAGLLLHYFTEKRLSTTLSKWNKEYYEQYVEPHGLLQHKYKCYHCEKSVKFFNTIFHFVDIHCTQRYTNNLNKGFLHTIKYACDYDFDNFRQQFTQAFPTLKLDYKGALSIRFNFISLDTLENWSRFSPDEKLHTEMEATEFYFLCNYCPTLLKIDEIATHRAQEIIASNDDYHWFRCLFCPKPFGRDGYFNHLVIEHSNELWKDVLIIFNPLYKPNKITYDTCNSDIDMFDEQYE